MLFRMSCSTVLFLALVLVRSGAAYDVCTTRPPCPAGLYYYCQSGKASNGCKSGTPFTLTDCTLQCTTQPLTVPPTLSSPAPSSPPPPKPPASPSPPSPSPKPPKPPSPSPRPPSPSPKPPSPPPPSPRPPSPTPASGHSIKKGFLWVDSDPNYGAWADILNTAWAYDWNCKRPSSYTMARPFIPMTWGSKYANNATLMAQLSVLGQPGIEDTLLGFNEPDMASQSNLTPDQAIAMWPLLVKTGRRLGAPAPAYNPLAVNSWLSQFMNKTKGLGLRVDFITLHWYGTPTSATGFLDMVDKVWAAYGLPIWVTEFSAADWSASPTNPTKYTAAQTYTFMQTVVPGLIARPYVERFAWMLAKTNDTWRGMSALFNLDGSITPLGQLWASY